MNKAIMGGLLLVAIAAAGFAFIQSRQSATLTTELRAVRAELDAATSRLEARDLEVNQLNQRLDRMKEDLADLPELRGEVTRLASEKKKLEEEMANARRLMEAARSQAQAQAQAAQARMESTGVNGVAELTLAQAPLAVRNRIAQQYPGATIGELVQVTEDGRTFYSVDGVTSNDREMHAVLDENGEILEQELELRFNEVPGPVQRAVGRQLGRDGGMDLRQTWEDGQTTYRGNAERDGQEMHFVFSESGELIRYEAWVEQPDDR